MQVELATVIHTTRKHTDFLLGLQPSIRSGKLPGFDSHATWTIISLPRPYDSPLPLPFHHLGSDNPTTCVSLRSHPCAQTLTTIRIQSLLPALSSGGAAALSYGNYDITNTLATE